MTKKSKYNRQNEKYKKQKYSRKTNRVVALLTKILVEISSVKGSYLTCLLNIGHSSSSYLRLVHGISIVNPVIPKCIGIDDWAKRKGRNYGTGIRNFTRTLRTATVN